MEFIEELIKESMTAKKEFISEAPNINNAANRIVKAFKDGKKILICGNGGSAADSQHMAAELVGRYKLERRGLPAIALTTDSSILTAWSNDYNYEKVFSRQVEALAKKGDVIVGISTSGNSKNVINAFLRGSEIGTINISLTGKDGGEIKKISDININSNSTNTPRIQECHMTAYHIICEIVEREMMENKK